MFLGCKTQLAKVLALAVPWWEPRFQAGVVRFARHVFWIESSMTVRQLVILFLAAGIAWGVSSVRVSVRASLSVQLTLAQILGMHVIVKPVARSLAAVEIGRAHV